MINLLGINLSRGSIISILIHSWDQYSDSGGGESPRYQLKEVEAFLDHFWDGYYDDAGDEPAMPQPKQRMDQKHFSIMLGIKIVIVGVMNLLGGLEVNYLDINTALWDHFG